MHLLDTRLLRLVQSFVLTGIFVVACGADDMPPPVGANGQPLRPCGTDGDCARPDPYCVGGYCAECLSDANCGGGTCSQTTFTCVQCTSNAQCGGLLPYCSTAGRCVQCVGSGNCAMGQTCNAVTNICQRACTDNTTCTPIAPYCSTTLGVCVACQADANCGGGNPYCNTQVGACVQCLADANCTGDRGGNRCVDFRCR